ncbi:MAG: enoyl-CoA hydratase-related protein, partial [Acidimicrobiia bacterium]
PLLREAFMGWVVGFAAAPLILLYPLFLIFFGRGFATIIAMSGVAAVTPIILKTVEGLDGTRAVLRGAKIWKPIIAAVNGYCTAGGMEMLGGVDIRLACPEAQFAVMEPKRGLFAGGGTTVRLPRQIPFPHAMEFLLCADLVPAERAMAMGLLNAIVPRDELLDAAYDYARRITANAPLAVQATKRSVWEGLGMPLKDAYRNESAISSEIFATEDAKEGPRAFAEKRPPRWQGK